MIEVDGSHGEGGGQLVRNAAALAAVTGKPIRIINIRSKRSNPGLAAQHVAALEAVAAVSGADIEGLHLRSHTVTVKPGTISGGKHRIDVGTAGSLTLVLQAVLPPALLASEPSEFHLTGGTDVPWSPPLDYFRFVFLPLLERMGGHVDVDMIKRGYYPRGGGEVRVRVRPSGGFRPLSVEPPGALRRIRGIAHAANLPEHVPQRMRQAAVRQILAIAEPKIEVHVASPDQASGPGGAVVLWTEQENTVLGASALAQKGTPAEKLGTSAAGELIADLNAKASLDTHASDQVLIYAALANGESRFSVRTVTPHATTTMWLLERLLSRRFETVPLGEGFMVRTLPR